MGGVVCVDRCAEELAAEQKEASKTLAGSRAREAYVRQAVGLKAKHPYASMDGGPDNVFVAARAAGCLKLNDGDYTYQVCLFEKVTQTGHGKTFTLGRNGDWATSLWEDGSQRKDYSKLVMGGGDYCVASGASRKVEVGFECA